MKTTKKLVATILLSIGGNVLAYDTSTHTAMTAAAAGKSRVGASPSFSVQIQTLGLRDYNFVLGDKYIDIGPQLLTRIGSGFEDQIILNVFQANTQIQIPDAYTLTGWLMRGAVREDDNRVEIPPVYQDEPGGTFNRPFGHFHDPQNDRGLTVAGIGILPRATDWALTNGTVVPYIPVANPVAGTNHFNAAWGQAQHGVKSCNIAFRMLFSNSGSSPSSRNCRWSLSRYLAWRPA